MSNGTPIYDILRENLDDDQLRAATDTSRSVLCLACAGSGKSRTMAFRAARLIAESEDPIGIVAFTFTNKAADKIKENIAFALRAAHHDPTSMGRMFIGTIHSFCQEMLSRIEPRYRQFDVLDDNRLKLYLLSRYSELNLNQYTNYLGRRNGQFKIIRQIADAWKIFNDEIITNEELSRHNLGLARTIENISRRLERDNFIDFSLMIRRLVDLLENEDPRALMEISNIRHLMVDEYQDVNTSQERLIESISHFADTLFVVGDDDQAIYSWRGSNVRNILEFESRYASSPPHTLRRNYRSTRTIVEAASGFIQNQLLAVRYPKDPITNDPGGPRDLRILRFPDRDSEAEWVAERIPHLVGSQLIERNSQGYFVRGLTLGDFAILMRSTREKEGNERPRHAAFTDALQRHGINYSIEAGGGLFERREVRVLRETMELLRAPDVTRNRLTPFFSNQISQIFQQANLSQFLDVMNRWRTLIHAPWDQRRRVFPQKFIYELLNSFGLNRQPLEDSIMRDIGVFSRIIQDVEAVYISIDTTQRYREILNFLQNVAESGYDTSTDELYRRPDVVTVSTVHKVKGLEYPSIFIVDVERERFPKRIKGYNKWIPESLIENALSAGCYQNTMAEEARLFYTALTRAERHLYMSWSDNLPGGVRARRASQFLDSITHSELSDDYASEPLNMGWSEPRARCDEQIIPTTFSEIRYYLRCPRDYQFRKGFGFKPAIKELFGFGRTVHTIICRLHSNYADSVPTSDEADRITQDTFHLKHAYPRQDPTRQAGPYERGRESAQRIISNYIQTYSSDFILQRQIEVPFEVPISENTVISGTIDLILNYDQNNNIVGAEIIDFKAISGTEEAIGQEDELYWTELALQVQLYAMAATQVLGENARTGSVHLLKSNQRVNVPIDPGAIESAVTNVNWAIGRIIEGEFPMRPHQRKCGDCDFRLICAQQPQEFISPIIPPPIHIPGDVQMIRAFSEYNPNFPFNH